MSLICVLIGVTTVPHIPLGNTIALSERTDYSWVTRAVISDTNIMRGLANMLLGLGWSDVHILYDTARRTSHTNSQRCMRHREAKCCQHTP